MTKYSLKNIFLGIGIGLIIASVANINTAPEKLTIDEIKREAQQYNLIVIEAKDMINKEPSAPAEPPKQQTEQQTGEKEAQVLTITIESGANSDTIAKQLFEKKLIKSEQEFINRLREQKRENKLQIGSFQIQMGSSVDKIIETITNLPK